MAKIASTAPWYALPWARVDAALAESASEPGSDDLSG
jgi:hypothetical protein